MFDLPRFTPENWFWRVGEDQDRWYSSAAAGYVTELPAGVLVTSIATEGELWVVLERQYPQGLPAGRFFPDLAPYQWESILDLAGLRATADAAIEALPLESERIVARHRMQKSSVYRRFDPLFLDLMSAAGLTTEQVDPLWQWASEL